MNNTGIMLVLAYPETIVRVSNEWYSPLLPFVGIGKRNYVRAGHAALVLINPLKEDLEYHDFGRYVVPNGTGRVRGKSTDHELDFKIKANFVEGEIDNLEEILRFLATNPKLIHGEGNLVASVCKEVNYECARAYINGLQQRDFIPYAAFKKEATNCSRFVTDTLIASTTNANIRRRLIQSNWFTPSTVSNVLIADTENCIFEVSEKGEIGEFKSSIWRSNTRYFLDRLNGFKPNLEGNILPKSNQSINGNAQWLSGIGSGAWFELFKTEQSFEYRFRRVSPEGHIDVEGLYRISDITFVYDESYEFIHYSNCNFYHIRQNQKIYRFDLIKTIN